MKKIFPFLLATFSVFLLAACSGGPGSYYSDNYQSPWNMAQTSENLQQAEAARQVERLEPQIDWRDSDNIQNNIQRGPSIDVADVEQENTLDRTTPVAAPPPTGVKVKVALLAPLSGQHEAIGTALLNAAQLALFDVGNENFELIPRDTEGTPEGAQNAARSAISDGANLIIGPLFSEAVTAIKPITRNAHVPVIAFSTDWNVAGGDTYIMGFLPFAQVARVTNFAIAQGYDRMAIFAPEGEYSRMVKTTLNNILSTGGSRIVREDIYPVTIEDLDTRFARFVDHDRRAASAYQDNRLPFNALVLPVGGPSLRTLTAYLSQYSVDPRQVKLIGTGLWDNPVLAGEPMLHGAWFAAPDPRLRRNFERSYRETYGTEAPRIASLAYDGTALAAILAQSAPADLTPADVYSKARLTSNRGFAGIDGIFRFRPQGLIERGLAVQEITRSGIRVIDPAPTAFVSAQKT